jgi:Flp pilus assembly protein CpaB
MSVGDRTDVLVVYRDDTTGDSVARTVAQNCLVLAMDRPGAVVVEPAPEEGKGKAKGKAKGKTETTSPPPEQKEPMARVMLAVTPTDAVKITAATSKGDIRLVLRNPTNIVKAAVDEEWEHPHRAHPHYPLPASPSPENITGWQMRPKGAALPPKVPTATRLPALPLRPGVALPAAAPAPPKSVEVVRGTTKETVNVRE